MTPAPLTAEALVDLDKLRDTLARAIDPHAFVWPATPARSASALAMVDQLLAPLLAALRRVTAERDEARALADGDLAAEALVEALAYLKPHDTNGGTISLKAAKAREAVVIIEASLQRVTAERDALRKENADIRVELDALVQEVLRNG